MRLMRSWLAIRHRPRLMTAFAVGAVAWLVQPTLWPEGPITRLIVAWNCGAWLYLALVGWMMVHADPKQIHHRSALEAEGARTILTLVALAAVFSLGAIVAELAVAGRPEVPHRDLHIALAVATLVSSWAFTQTMFALHYAHDYYLNLRRGQPGGLSFPDMEEPDYIDFLYFAAVIGTSGQTADVSFTGRGMRRVGLLHCVLAFFFNASLIGLMINVASSLIH
ncbi:DUF1345 domain-containing protein [Sphaerotilus sp.]|uniref:DUF1345 domain-containing protein n=1 Tax=Sphaerotilus sp. TaxID=2093942 RepID=UPI0034E1A324